MGVDIAQNSIGQKFADMKLLTFEKNSSNLLRTLRETNEKRTNARKCVPKFGKIKDVFIKELTGNIKKYF